MLFTEREKHMFEVADVEKPIIAIDRIERPQTLINTGLPIKVIFTSLSGTLNALVKANQMARSNKSPIEILVFMAIHFAVPLEDRSIRLEFLVRQLKEMADQFSEQIKISVYLCRDQWETMAGILDRNCLILMGVSSGLWPTHDERIARMLRHAGHNVILIKPE